MRRRPTGHAQRSRLARGFTLVELLIAMTLTLMLVYAVAQFYAFMGETVRDGRAQIEMGGQLRAVSLRLQQDFAELTVRVGGKIDAGQGMGCLEIWEGIACDSDPNGDRQVNAQGISNDLLDASGNNPLDLNGDGKADSAMLGDCDDILVMTIRSQGEPFVGRWWNSVTGAYQIVQSNLAEVIWFTTFKDVNANGSWQMNEPRYLVRRQLLIRPDLAISYPNSGNPLPQGQSIFHHNDISCRVLVNNSGNFAGYAANSLSDLSQRENRCVHQNLSNLNFNGLDVANIMGQGHMPNTMQLNVGLTDVPSIPLYQPGSCSLYSLDGILQFIGEDKVLSNVVAFDVRVYDPYAGLWADNLNSNATDAPLGVLSPGDPGYAFAIHNAVSNGVNNRMGNGAFVDLWYTRAFVNLPAAGNMKNNVLSNCNSAYAWAPQSRNFPGGAVWDTWSTAYEKDGSQQIPFGFTQRLNPDMTDGIDWLIDGLDNSPSINGVDDPSEAETQPPYPSWAGSNGIDDDGQNGVDDASEVAWSLPGGVLTPAPTTLRGIEVRIRMYEPGTRQTRQATVGTDFIPE
ncbi:MAG: type II secretion system protein J [Pirellulaceae bacterium]